MGVSQGGCPDTTHGQPSATKVSDTSRGNLLTGHRTKRPRNIQHGIIDKGPKEQSELASRNRSECQTLLCSAGLWAREMYVPKKKKGSSEGAPKSPLNAHPIDCLSPAAVTTISTVKNVLEENCRPEKVPYRLTEAGLPKHASKHPSSCSVHSRAPPPLSGYC